MAATMTPSAPKGMSWTADSPLPSETGMLPPPPAAAAAAPPAAAAAPPAAAAAAPPAAAAAAPLAPPAAAAAAPLAPPAAAAPLAWASALPGNMAAPPTRMTPDAMPCRNFRRVCLLGFMPASPGIRCPSDWTMPTASPVCRDGVRSACTHRHGDRHL